MKHAPLTMLGLAVALVIANTGHSQAAEHVIEMLDKGRSTDREAIVNTGSFGILITA
jgi:hypothetical protein